jgi:hypothetical protein
MTGTTRGVVGLALALSCLATVRDVALCGRQAPVFRTGIDVVRVDVLVTDAGRAVSGLTAADF